MPKKHPFEISFCGWCIRTLWKYFGVNKKNELIGLFLTGPLIQDHNADFNQAIANWRVLKAQNKQMVFLIYFFLLSTVCINFINLLIKTRC